MSFEKFGAFAGVGVGLNPAELGVLLAKLNGLYAVIGEQARDVRTRLGNECVGKEITVAVHNTKHRLA